MTDHREAILIRLTEIVHGELPWLRAGLCPPPSHGVGPIEEILSMALREVELIREENDLRNLTGETQRG